MIADSAAMLERAQVYYEAALPFLPAVLGTVLGALLVVYPTTLFIYRLFFHPLRSFPGPRLAAMTTWYEFYYNWWREGEAVYHYREWHDKYGPIIRINPNELHFSNPDIYNTIYLRSHPRFIKHYPFYRMFLADTSSVCIIDPHQHRIRRSLMSFLFSRQNVIDNEAVVLARVHNLLARFSRALLARSEMDMTVLFKCLTSDVVSAFCYGNSFDFLTLPDERPDPRFLRAAMAWQGTFWFMQKFWRLQRALFAVPDWIMNIISPDLLGMGDLYNQCLVALENDRASLAAADAATDEKSKTVKRTLFTELLAPSQNVEGLSSKDRANIRPPSTQELLEEATIVMAAGTEEASNVMMWAMYYYARDADVRRKTLAELRAAWPDKRRDISWTELENLTYFTSVVKEAMRLSHSVPGRLPRVTPAGGVEVDGKYIPGGTLVGMSSYVVHTDPTIYPNPHAFNPDRWINPSTGKFRAEMERYFLAFSKGSRGCLGINLAYSEILITLAHIFRKYEFVLVDEKTNEQSMRWMDQFVSVTRGHVVVRVVAEID